MIAEAKNHADTLAKFGLTDGLLAELTKATEELEVLSEEVRVARRGHVGARADLEAVASELVQMVEVLDGIYRYRFGDESTQLVAWRSARNVANPVPPKDAEPPASGGLAPTA